MTMSSEAKLKKKRQRNSIKLQAFTGPANAPTVKIQLVAGTVRDKKKELGYF